MLFENVTFNPVCDIQDVDQTGAIDLAKAHSMGSVPANLEVDELKFNQIEDPNSIIGRASDTFEAMQLGKAALERVPDGKKE